VLGALLSLTLRAKGVESTRLADRPDRA
jgi:hypothetical protein